MEPLLDEFLHFDAKADEDSEHPVLGPNEIFKFRAFSLSGYTLESAANLRWSDASNEEMTVMRQRMKRIVDWTELITKMDSLTERWLAPLAGGAQTAICKPQDFTKPTAKGRSHVIPIDPALVLSMCVSTVYAVVLLRNHPNVPIGRGSIWRFPVCEVDAGKWRPAPKLAPVENYQVSFCVQAHLFLLDGPMLCVIDLNHGEMFRTNLYQAARLPANTRFDSMKVNHACVVLLKSQDSGRVVLAYISLGSSPSLEVIETTFSGPSVTYTSIGLTPASGLEHTFLLGRVDGIIEQYQLELSEKETKLNQVACFNLFEPKISSVSGLPLKVESGHPIQGVFQRGHRISAYTDRDWVALSTIVGVPQVFRRHRPDCPLVDMHTMGDMTASLKANGELSLWGYSSTALSQAADEKSLCYGPENYIPGGQQRVAMLPDVAVALLQHGRLVFILLK